VTWLRGGICGDDGVYVVKFTAESAQGVWLQVMENVRKFEVQLAMADKFEALGHIHMSNSIANARLLAM